MKNATDEKRDKGHTLIRASTSLTNSFRSLVAKEPLPFGWGCAASMIAAPAADLTSLAAPFVYTCVVTGVDALLLGPLGTDLALDLDLLLLDDERATGGPSVDDNGSGFFTSADVKLLG